MESSEMKITADPACEITPPAEHVNNEQCVLPVPPIVRKIQRPVRNVGIIRTQSLHESAAGANPNTAKPVRKNISKILSDNTGDADTGKGEAAAKKMDTWMPTWKRPCLQRSNSVKVVGEITVDDPPTAPAVVVEAVPKKNLVVQQLPEVASQEKPEERPSSSTNETNETKPTISVRLESITLKARKCLEAEVFENMKALPSVMVQQGLGVDCIPKFNWMTSFNSAKSHAAEEEDAAVSFRIIYQYFFQVQTAVNLVKQIRHDFQHGLAEYRPTNPNNNAIDQICRQMDVCRVGTRGRNAISHGMIPYLKDIFLNEMKKQAKFERRMPKVLVNPRQIKKRTEVVNWILKISETHNYHTETVHLAVYIVDAYVSNTKLDIGTFEWGLLGVCAVHIAGKLEETNAVFLRRIILYSGQYFREKDVIRMEAEVLKRLELHVYPPMAPLLVNLLLVGGSLEFPDSTGKFRQLVQDISLGVLHQSLLNYKLVNVAPSEKAKIALEVAVEFVYHQYKFCNMFDLRTYKPAPHNPGHIMGEFALSMCVDNFAQRFALMSNIHPPSALPVEACPVKNIKT